MIVGLSLNFLSIFYLIILCLIYLSKVRIKNLDNKLYKFLIINSLVSLSIEILCIYTVSIHDKMPLLNEIVNRFFLVTLFSWIITFAIYVYESSSKHNNSLYTFYKKHLKKILIIIGFASFLIILFTNIEYFFDGKYVYSYGVAINFVSYSAFFVVALVILILFINGKNINKNNRILLFLFVFAMFLVVLIRSLFPGILLTTVSMAIVTFLMYFTIENPDMKMIEQLNFEKDRADKANNAKSEFLSNMSHEIRTPLNAIVGFSQSLEDEELPPSAKEQLKDIVMASESLVELVNGILDISKIEANKLEIVNSEYSFKKIFNELCALSKARMGDKGLDFRASYDESIPGVLYGDHMRLKQIILNLLTNAIKYTKEGYIDFKINSVIKDNVCRLIISVEDSGIGIKKENIEKCFTKFDRNGVEKDTTVEGTGLGLAITQRLIDLMRGKIVVQSEYGKGSRFTVAIDQMIVKGKETAVLEQTQKIDIVAIHAENKKVLVVDDNKLNLKVAHKLLEKYEVIVEEANSGDECLSKISSGNKYDLILMDDMMPKMSGIQTLGLLKTNNDFNTPVVVLTANAISGMREKYLKDGFDDYLSKPIELPELNRVVKKYLDK